MVYFCYSAWTRATSISDNAKSLQISQKVKHSEVSTQCINIAQIIFYLFLKQKKKKFYPSSANFPIKLTSLKCFIFSDVRWCYIGGILGKKKLFVLMFLVSTFCSFCSNILRNSETQFCTSLGRASKIRLKQNFRILCSCHEIYHCDKFHF